ncbi:hypothetical protein D9758_004994 [Tetrapyrgos nigripes]|uniref:WD40 repeat-like protein n=1 Tax=Tetrapyrgos nigripes TaxID=182062 RepID=A0A8H5LWR0_9AGAR|nr:hypothetical protein D9758_004994 [Tetrapyrgos nigripes]
MQMFTNASNFQMENTTVTNIGRDQVNVTNNYYNESGLALQEKKLQPIMNTVRKKDICMNGTRVQLLKDLSDWVLQPDSRVAIAVSLAEQLRKMNDQVILALTFHCVKGQDTSKESPLKFKDDTSLNANGLPLQEQFNAFLDVSLLNFSTGRKVVIIIDGLDEWETSIQWKILSQSLVATSLQVPWLRVIITSCPQVELDKSPNANIAVKSFNLMEQYKSDVDIQMFFQERLNEPGIQNFADSDTKKLVAKAGGLFIWATTALTFIQDDVDEERNLQLILGLPGQDVEGNNPYTELYTLYQSILKQCFKSTKSQKLFRDIVGVLLAVEEPISTSVLVELLQSLKISVEKVLHILKALKLYYHLSLKEFLSSSSTSDDFHVQLLVQNCVGILVKELRFNICGLELSTVKNTDVQNPSLSDRIQSNIRAHLQYSCMYWTTHLANGGDISGEIVGRIEMLMNGKWLIYWIECMSLVDRIHKLKENISSSIQNKNVEDLADKASKLINTFSVQLNESTPHLYVSALAMVSQLDWFGDYIKKRVHIENFHLSSHLLTINTACRANNVAYSPDGKHVVSGSDDITVRMWDIYTARQVGEALQGHIQRVYSVAYSPDEKYVVSGSANITVRVWNTDTGQQVGEPLQGHTDWANSVAYSPDGKHVVSGSCDKTVRIWNSETGQQMGQPLGQPLHGHTGIVWSVAWSPDGKDVVSGSEDQTIRIWHTETALQGKDGEVLQGHTKSVMSVAYSPDGKDVVSGSSDYTVRIWDTETGKEVGEPFQGHTDSVYSVAYSPDGKHMVSGSLDNTVRIWDSENGQQVEEPLQGHTDWVMSVGYSPDGKHIGSGSDDRTVRIWNIETRKQKGNQIQGHTDRVLSVAYSSDKKHVVSGCDDTTVRIWDTDTAHKNMGHCDWTANGKHVVSGSDDKTVRIWDTVTGQQVGKQLQGHDETVWSVAYCPDGKHVVSGSTDNTVRIWKWHVVSGSSDNTVRILDTEEVDGKYVVSGSDDQTIRLWDTETGQQVGYPMQGHTDWVSAVAYSPDGKHMMSGSGDCTIRIWDTQVEPTFPKIQDIPPSYAHSPPDEPCHINEQGWLCTKDQQSKLILWLPPNFHGIDCRQVLTIPSNTANFSFKVDWSNFAYGQNWTQVWEDED